MNNNKINESGLRQDILRDLIFPIVSIDEYTPKMDDNNIVVLFQVLQNYDAAYDLSAFIERSPENVVDTEVNETPNVDGRYNVFVEFERNLEFPSKFLQLLKDIENICPNPGWKLQLYKINDPIDVDAELLGQNLMLSSEEEIREFFDYAALQVNFLKENKKVDGIQFNSVFGNTIHFDYISSVLNESDFNNVLGSELQLDNTTLSRMLGESEYTVMRKGDRYYVGREGKFVVLK